MPGATSKYQLPYPLLSEPPNGPEGFRTLAEAVEGVISDVSFAAGPSTSRPPHRAGLAYYETDTNGLYVSDGSTWHNIWQRPNRVNLSPPLAAGWANADIHYVVAGGGLVAINGELDRTGGDMVATSGGNVVPDADVWTSLPAVLRPYAVISGWMGRPGVQTGICRMQPSGAVSFTDGVGGATYPNGRYIVQFFYHTSM